MAISPISAAALIQPPASIVSGEGTVSGFGNLLASAIQNVESAGQSANAAAQNFLAGGNQELHSTILASQSADLDFELFLQARNKVVSAYEEIMRMQL